MFSDRDRFIQAITVFMVSEDARQIPMEERQKILDYIRKTKCKSILNSEWQEIAKTVNDNRKWILDAITDYKKPIPESTEPESTPDVTESESSSNPENPDDDSDPEQDSEPSDMEQPEKKKRFGFSFKKSNKSSEKKTNSLRTMFSKKNDGKEEE